MTAFKLFDPYAFLGAVEVADRRQPDHPARALAGFAGLAARPEAAQNLEPKITSPRGGNLAAFATLAGQTLRSEVPDQRWPPAARSVEAAKAARIANTERLPETPVRPSVVSAEQVVCAWIDGVARLDAERPPLDVPPRRWRQFIYDAGRFLDGGFPKQAAALGWDAYDLFGCDRDRPFARIDNAGLLWLLDGNQLLALTEQSARVETRTASTQTYRRKPGDPGRVLAWHFEP